MVGTAQQDMAQFSLEFSFWAGLAWIEAKTDFYNIDLDQEDLYDGDVQRMTGDSRSVGLVVSSDNSFYFVYICACIKIFSYYHGLIISVATMSASGNIR